MPRSSSLSNWPYAAIALQNHLGWHTYTTERLQCEHIFLDYAALSTYFVAIRKNIVSRQSER